jgi:hypothetical protein
MQIPYDKVNPIIDNYLMGLITGSELAHQLVDAITPITCQTPQEFKEYLHEYFTTVLHSKVDDAWDFSHELIGFIIR